MSYGTTFLLNNKKQKEFLKDIDLLSPKGYRYFFYGGSIRGGKSFVILFILHYLALKYEGSKSIVVRDYLPTLKKTTIPSFIKLLGKYASYHGTMNYSSNEFTYNNGSKILFMAENISHDPQLDAFLGIEANFFFLEQIEELSQKMFEMAKQRSGSLYIPNMPPAYIFSSFNPTNRWIKKEIYDKYRMGTLDKPYYYLNASPKDNPFVTEDQWSAWSTMDDRSYRQFIEGDWDVTNINDNRFIYTFDYNRHKAKEHIEIDNSMGLYLSFDFNVNPCTAILGQHNRTLSKVVFLKEYRVNGGVEELCDVIKLDIPNTRFLTVTGDSSGKNRNSVLRGSLTHYSIIQRRLGLSNLQLKVPKANKRHQASRSVCNSLLDKHKDLSFNDMPYLFADFDQVEVNNEGGIKKEIGEVGHLLDCFRYYCDNFLDYYVTKRK